MTLPSIQPLLAKFRSSDFARNSLILSAGVALAQVLPFLFYPVLGRIFTSEEFGLLATLTSVITVLSVAGSGKYESGIVIADGKREAANLAVLSVAVGFVALLVGWLLCQFVLLRPLTSWLHQPDLGRWFYLCPLAAFSIIVFNVYNEWCVREKYFKSLAVNKIINSSAVVLSKTLFGFWRIFAQGLVMGDVIGRAISALGCVVRALWRDGRTFLQVRWADMKRCAVKFREFPLFNMPGRLLNSLGQSIPIWLLAAYYGQTEVGLFSMALTLFSVPINIISTSVSDVFRQKATEEFKSQGQCLSIFNKIMFGLGGLGLVLLLALVWFLPGLCTLFLGDQWYETGVYAQILSPAMVLMFVSNSLSGMFVVANKQRAFFWWQLYFSASTLVSVWLGCTVFGTITATLILFSLFRSSAYLASLIMTRVYAKGEGKPPVEGCR